MKKFTFRKKERLTKKKIIDSLFETGKRFTLPPFRIIFLPVKFSDGISVKTIISVSKKIFRKAVQRNRIKRKIREAYRKNKEILYEFLERKHLQMAVAILYTAKEEVIFSEIETKLISCLKRLRKEALEKHNN